MFNIFDGIMKKSLILLLYIIVTLSVFSQNNSHIKGSVIISVKQKEANIFINGELVGKGCVEMLLQSDKEYSYKIECNLYHTETGKLMVTAGEIVKIDKDLRPAYGFMNINTEPQESAVVFIDGVKVGTTPYKSDKLPSGTYTVKVIKEMFKTKEQCFTVTDGNTTFATINMEVEYEMLTVNSDYDADIYIDGEYKGEGTWCGYVLLGMHNIEVRKDKYKSISKSVYVVLGEKEIINIKNLEPIHGTLELRTSPTNANVYIDGQYLGQTPLVESNVIIGKHQLLFQKEGCSSKLISVEVIENELICINETLQTGKEVLIKTDKSGDKLYIDGSFVGKTPFITHLSYGKHELKSSRRSYTTIKNIELRDDSDGQTSSSTQTYVLLFETLDEYLNKGMHSLTLNMAYSLAPQVSLGLTYGYVRKIGWFVSVMSNFNFRFNATPWNDISYLDKAVFSGESSKARLSFTGGLVIKTIGPIYAKIGAGYGLRVKCWKVSNNWYEYEPDTYRGIDLTAGLMLNTNGCTISCDVVTTNFKTIETKVGFGINWN